MPLFPKIYIMSMIYILNMTLAVQHKFLSTRPPGHDNLEKLELIGHRILSVEHAHILRPVLELSGQRPVEAVNQPGCGELHHGGRQMDAGAHSSPGAKRHEPEILPSGDVRSASVPIPSSHQPVRVNSSNHGYELRCTSSPGVAKPQLGRN